MKQLQNLFCLFLFLTISLSLSAQTASVSEGCLPLEVSFTPPAGASSFNWTFGDGGTSTLANPTHIFNTTGSFSVEFRNSSGGTVVGTVNVDVYAKTELMITADPAASGCRPLLVEFDASGSTIDPNVTVNSYIWNYGDGSPSDSGMNPSHTFNGNDDSYDIFLEISTNLPTCNAVLTFPSFINISDPPEVSFTADPQGSCTAPANINFTNTSPDPNLSFTWDFGDNNTSTMTNPSHSYAVEGIYTVTLTAADANGCSNSSTQFIGIGTPTVAFTVPETVCVGVATPITNNSVAGASAWDFGNGQTSSAASPSVTYNTAGTYDITLTVTTGANCTSTLTKTVEAVVADASFTSSPTYSCDATLTATFVPTMTNPDASYLWTFGDTTTSTAMSPTHTFNGVDADPYSINMPVVFVNSLTVDVDGCMDSRIRFDTLDRPNARFMPDVLSGCAPLTVEFSDSSFSTQPIVSWDYDFGGDGTASDNTGSPVSHTFTTAGDYDVVLTITNAAGCQDTSFAITILVGDPLEIGFMADNTTVCVGETVNFTPNNLPPEVDSWHFETDNGRSFHCYQDSEMGHAFATEVGSFDVSLVTENNGCLGTVTVPNLITVNGAIAEIAYEIDCATPYDVQFRNVGQSLVTPFARWDFGDGSPVQVGSAPLHTYAMTGDYQVILTVETENTGCVATHDTVTVCIRDLQAAFEIDSLICTGKEYMLDASTSQDVDARCWRGFTWDIPLNTRPITTQEESIPFIFVTPGDETIELIARDINGCLDTATYDVRVYELRPMITASETSICLPAEVNFTDGSTGDTTIVSWEWNFGDGGMSTDQNPTHVYNNASSNPITVSVIVTDAIGCDSEGTTSIDLYTPFTSIAPTPSAICVGETVSFSAMDFTAGGSSLSTTWDFGNGQTGTGFFNNITYNTPGTYTVTLDYQEIASGCEGPTVTRDIVVQAYPEAAFTTNEDGNPLICTPALIEFTDASTTTDVLSYTWNFDTGLTSSLMNPTNNYTNRGTYDVELTVSTIPAGCSSSVTRSFTIVGPEGDFTIDPNAICRDGEVTVNLIDTVDVAQYAWNFGDGNSIMNQSPYTHQFNLDENDSMTVVILTLVDQNGCEFLAENTVEIVNIIADFTPSDDGTTCLGGTMTFQNNSKTADTYLWDFGDGTSSTDENPSHVYNAIGTYTVTLTATNTPFGCTESTTQEITVGEDLELDIIPTTVCVGEQATIFSTNADLDGTYNWQPANLFVDNTLAQPTTVALSATTDFTVTFVTSAGCEGSGAGTVTVEQPIVPFNDRAVIFEGESIDLPINPNGNNINWMLDSDTTNMVITGTVNAPGVYTAVVSDNCGNTVNYTFELVVIAEPKIPNVFTPNRDQKNDFFNIILNDLSFDLLNVSEFKIYNRWGQLIYDNDTPNTGWDGNLNENPSPSDVYLYFIEASYPEYPEAGTFTFRGDVTLIR